MLPSANSSATPNAPAASDLSEVNSTPKSNQHKPTTKLPESRSANQKDAAGDFMAMKPTLIDRSSSVANATRDGQGRLRAKPGQWLVLRQQDFSPATADKSLDSDTIVLATICEKFLDGWVARCQRSADLKDFIVYRLPVRRELVL